MVKYSPEAWSDFVFNAPHELQEWIEGNNITPDTILRFNLTNYVIVHQPRWSLHNELALRPHPYNSRVLHCSVDELKVFTVNTELTLEQIFEKERTDITKYVNRLIEDRRQRKNRTNPC